jgi:hypothetical protein
MAAKEMLTSNFHVLKPSFNTGFGQPTTATDCVHILEHSANNLPRPLRFRGEVRLRAKNTLEYGGSI